MKKYYYFIFDRVFMNKKSTLIGCIIAAMGGIGDFLSNEQGTQDYGKIISSSAIIFASLVKLMDKDNK